MKIVYRNFLLLFAVAGMVQALLSGVDRGHAAAQSAGVEEQGTSPETLMARGMAAYQRGDFRQAVVLWGEAAAAFERAGNTPRRIDALREQGQAYQSLGQYGEGLARLQTALNLARESGERKRTASLMGGIGNAYVAIGPPRKAYENLTEALKMAEEEGDSALSAMVLNNLGNLLVAQEKYKQALQAYGRAERLALQSGKPALASRTLTNAAIALTRLKQFGKARAFFDKGLREVRQLPNSHGKAFVLINIGLGYNELRGQLPASEKDLMLAANGVFRGAAQVAEAIGDSLALSYALGYRGQLYEAEKRYVEALRLTRRAMLAAQQIKAPESLYLWQWQTGRILKAEEKIDEAIVAYRNAVSTLQAIRQEMNLGYAASGSSFREAVGPVYFQLVDLLLHPDAKSKGGGLYERSLLEARNTVELFKAAELRDYFRDDCVDSALAKRRPIEEVLASHPAAIIYPIILSDRVETLVTLPADANTQGPGDKKIRFARYTRKISEDEFTGEIRMLRQKLEKRTTREYLPIAQRVYKWLIGPDLEKELEASKIDTLVFVPDGALRTIPMSALHDGKQFLIEKYAVAVAPGIDLTDPRPLRREEIKVMAAGLTEGVQGFSPLPFVANELKEIGEVYGVEPIVDQEFVGPRIEKEMRRHQYNIVHIASHGQFGNTVNDTFVLTFDDKLTMDRLDDYVGRFRYREEPLELLTLSACETAAGDDRAALGLAGIAVKAGARSALATLWFINDQASSEIVKEFYRELHDKGTSRAVALQRAQVKLIKAGNHPALWSPFLLINNWL